MPNNYKIDAIVILMQAVQEYINEDGYSCFMSSLHLAGSAENFLRGGGLAIPIYDNDDIVESFDDPDSYWSFMAESLNIIINKVND